MLSIGCCVFMSHGFACEKLFQRQIVFRWHTLCIGWRVQFIFTLLMSCQIRTHRLFSLPTKAVRLIAAMTQANTGITNRAGVVHLRCALKGNRWNECWERLNDSQRLKIRPAA